MKKRARKPSRKPSAKRMRKAVAAVTIAAAALAHPEERTLWRSVAEAIRPRPLVPPSDWAEANIKLSREQSESQPGPFRCDWKPFTRDLHDCLYNEPTKLGVIAVKPSRIGFSRAVVNGIGAACDTAPDPMLYLIDTKEQASFWAAEHFDPMIQAHERLKRMFTRPETESGSKRRVTTITRPFIGGRVDFAGAGTAGAVTSRGYARVYLDEYERILDVFPRSWGSPLRMAEGRVKEARDRSQIWAFSHPRRAHEGIHDLYERLSDCRQWMFDCPHCEAGVFPTHHCVHFDETNEEGEPDPTTARLRCPHCGETITDAQRAKAVWPPSLGGTGRFESTLSPGEAAKRRYIGLWVVSLCDPFVTVREFAAGLVTARSSEAEMQTFLNMAGEPYTPAAMVVTVDVVERAIKHAEQIVVPGGRMGCQVLTIGADVQAPRENPTLYVRSTAWSPSHAFVVDYCRVSGWAAFAEYIRTLTVQRHDGETKQTDQLAPMAVGIDCAWLTSQVLDFCRLQIVHQTSHALVQLVPMQFAAHIKATSPAVVPSEQRRIDPARPWLGAMKRWDLHRHTWVNREMARWSEGRVTVLCVPPNDLASHVTANVLAPVPDKHNWGNPDLVWTKIEKRRDDYAMAGAYGEAVAALECNLDALHAIAHAPPPPPAENVGRGWLENVLPENW